MQNGILLSHKRNIFDSLLVRWMNLEPIIQNEVSQKEQDKYYILVRILKAKKKSAAENEMVTQHNQSNGHEYEQTPGGSEGQRSLACCSPWGCRESGTTQQLNNNGIQKDDTNEPFYRSAIEMQTQRTDLWTQVGKERVG